MKRSIGNPEHYPYAAILRLLPHPVERVTSLRHAVKQPSHSLSRRARKTERDNHEDESKIIFFIITIGGALLFPFYGPSTS